MFVEPIEKHMAQSMVVKNHYLHRRANISFAFGLFAPDIAGVVTFGTPASRHLQMGACPTDPDLVIELNRLWTDDELPRNTESWFLARAIKMLPPRIIVSYADTTRDHMGFVYRAANFFYAGWTDMERKTARYDYLAPGKHTRDAFRSGLGAKSERVRRKPKIKYWTVSGDRRERRNMKKVCGWPSMCWREYPPPTEHQKFNLD